MARLVEFLEKHGKNGVHIIGSIDHDYYKIISIELTPNKHKYSHLHIRLYKENDQYGHPIKREDLAYQEGKLFWRQDLEYMKSESSDENDKYISWMNSVTEVIKVYIKKDNEWESGEWTGQECVVCYKNLEVDTSLPCGHMFCRKCIMEWAKVNHSCPCCRREFRI